MTNFQTMNKNELREAFRHAGLSYGQMSVADMKDTLEARQNLAEAAKARAAKARAVKSEAVACEPRVAGRPKPGGKCAAIWDFCDKAVAGGVTPQLAQVRAELDLNETTVAIQFYRWRKFVGYTKGSE
jgi:hypothetical protein